MFYTVYRVTNLINNKVYVGAHSTNDLNDKYMGSGKLIIKAIRKYGSENFTKDILYIFDNENDMFQKEQEIVNEWFVKQTNNYNLRQGGLGNIRGFNTYYNTVTEEYESLHKDDIKIKDGVAVNMTVGKITAIKNGEFTLVDMKEFISDDSIVGVCKGKVPVFLKGTDKCIQIDVEEYRKNKHLYTNTLSKNGNISVIDKNSVRRRVTRDIYKSDESLTSINKGYVSSKNIITGEIIRVPKEIFDLSDNLVGVTKGDSNGKYYYQIYNNLNELIYDSIINIRLFIKNNNSPSVFNKSQKNNGEPIYQKLGSNESRLRKNNMLQYRGWYCLRIEKDKL